MGVVAVASSHSVARGAEDDAASSLGQVLARFDVGYAWDQQPGFSPDGSLYAFTTKPNDDGPCTLLVFRLDDATSSTLATSSSAESCMEDVAWSAGAATLVWTSPTVDDHRAVYAWDAGDKAPQLVAADADIVGKNRVQVSPDGQYIAFGGGLRADPTKDRGDYVYSRADGHSHRLGNEDRAISFGGWAPTGHTFSAAVLDPTTFSSVGTCYGSGETCGGPTPFSPYAWSDDGRYVTASTGDGTAQWVYEPATGKSVAGPRLNDKYTGLAWARHSDEILTLYTDDGIGLWNWKTGAVRDLGPGTTEIAPDGERLLLDHGNGTIDYLQSSVSQAQRTDLTGTTGSWSLDSRFFVGPNGAGNGLRIWSAESRNTTFLDTGLSQGSRLQLSRDGQASSSDGRFVFVSSDSTDPVKLLDLSTQTLFGGFHGRPGTWSPKGDVAALSRVQGSGWTQVILVRAGQGGAPPPVPSPLRWASPTPADGTRFDVLPAHSAKFRLKAVDARSGVPVLSLRVRGAKDPADLSQVGLSCTFSSKAGEAEASCRVKPGDRALTPRLVDVDASDANGAAGARTFLVGSSPLQYLALGDSFSSGEGVDPYLRDGYRPGESGPQDDGCHRSTRAYAEQVRLSAAGSSKPLYVLASAKTSKGSKKNVNKYGSEANVRTHGNYRWMFWACSGAVMANVLPSADGGTPQAHSKTDTQQYTQLDNPSVDVSTDVVTITIGGNDLGFRDLLTRCALDNCDAADIEAAQAKAQSLKPLLEATYRAIQKKTFNARVYVLGYPQVFPASAKEQRCTKLLPWRGEQEGLRRVGKDLNATIRAAAESAGATYVDVAGSFAGHEICGSKGEWLNGPSFTVKANRKLLDDESFHPKLSGQFKHGYTDVVRAKIR